VVASAIPDWVCALQGSVVGAGIAIAFSEASAAWTILAQGGWTAGCVVFQRAYLSFSQISWLSWYQSSHEAYGCMYNWPRNHHTWSVRCTNYYA
jgi:hypothetical protein